MINAQNIRRAQPLVLAAIAAATLTGCGFMNQFKSTRTISERTMHMDDSPLTVVSSNGSIEVIGSPDVTEVEIVATIYCSGETQAEADARVQEASIEVARSTDGTLTVKPIFPVKQRNNDGASFVITIPNAMNVTLDTSNGSIKVSDLAGRLFADTSNGRIEVLRHDGDVECDSSNGRVICTEINGSVLADTSNGRIELTDVDGDIHADTSNGKVIIALMPGQTGQIVADSSNGSINVTVAEGFHGTFSMDTSNSGVTVKDPNGRASTNIRKSSGSAIVGNGSDRESLLTTSNGSITLKID